MIFSCKLYIVHDQIKSNKKLDFDLKIERIIRNLRKSKQEQEVKIENLEVDLNQNAVNLLPQSYARQDYAIPPTQDTIASVF